MRYFTDDRGTVWRYDGSKLEGRLPSSYFWSPSIFNHPSELMESLDNIKEVYP